MQEFHRISRLPPYVFNITGELKMAARRRGEDIIDMSMGNVDGHVDVLAQLLVLDDFKVARHRFGFVHGFILSVLPRRKEPVRQGGWWWVLAPSRKRSWRNAAPACRR